MSLEDIIETKRQSTRLTEANEEQIKHWLIAPLLAELGWDLSDDGQVIPEYTTPGTQDRVDYCLLTNGPQVFLEAKSPSRRLMDYEEQLRRYAFNEGVPISILTNGFTWRIYLPLEQGPFHDRRVYTINLHEQETSEVAEIFRALLSRAAVESGSALESAREMRRTANRNRRIEEALPIVWREMIQEPDPAFVHIFSDRVEDHCGYRPGSDEIEDYLGSVPDLPRQANAQAMPAPPQRRHPGAPNPPPAIRLNGRHYQPTTYKDLLVQFCAAVNRQYPDKFSRIIEIRGHTRVWFSEDPNQLISAREIPGTSVYAETNLSGDGTRDRCRRVIRDLDLPDTFLTFLD